MLIIFNRIKCVVVKYITLFLGCPIIKLSPVRLSLICSLIVFDTHIKFIFHRLFLFQFIYIFHFILVKKIWEQKRCLILLENKFHSRFLQESKICKAELNQCTLEHSSTRARLVVSGAPVVLSSSVQPTAPAPLDLFRSIFARLVSHLRLALTCPYNDRYQTRGTLIRRVKRRENGIQRKEQLVFIYNRV